MVHRHVFAGRAVETEPLFQKAFDVPGRMHQLSKFPVKGGELKMDECDPVFPDPFLNVWHMEDHSFFFDPTAKGLAGDTGRL